MALLRNIFWLLSLDLHTEWRRKESVSAALLLAGSLLFFLYLSLGTETLSPPVWNSLWWTIFLFLALYVSSRTAQDHSKYVLQLALVASATEILLAKILFHALLMLLFSSLLFGLYVFFFGQPLSHAWSWIWVHLGTCLGMSVVLSVLGLVVAKTETGSLLFATLSLPLLLPLLLSAWAASARTLYNMASGQETALLWAIVCLYLGLCLLFFPQAWRA